MNNALLIGVLEEEVYMQQQLGFQNSKKQLVCRLNKAIYGLKQAPTTWYDKLKHALL